MNDPLTNVISAVRAIEIADKLAIFFVSENLENTVKEV